MSLQIDNGFLGSFKKPFMNWGSFSDGFVLLRDEFTFKS